MTSLHCEKKTTRLNSKLTTHPSISMDDYMNHLYAHCEKTIKKAVEKLNGVISISISLEDKMVAVEYDTQKVDLQTIKDTIEDNGYEVR